MMRENKFSFSTGVLFILFFLSFTNTKPIVMKVGQTSPGISLVELFTSEGCSSCPPADKLLADIQQQYRGKVVVLSFHVDYWNSLGWMDPFSNAAYTKRQQQYGAFFHLNSIYTPQAIVNGKTEFVGSDGTKMRSVLTQQQNASAENPLRIKSATGEKGKVNIQNHVSENRTDILQIALVEKNTQSDVKAGENSGRHLAHVNVVRDFKSVNVHASNDGQLSMVLPEGDSISNYFVVAFLQNAENYAVHGVATCEIEK